MNREIIQFTTEEDWLNNRKRDLTSTDIAALFGVGYMTEFELWHHKKNGTSPDFQGNERTEFGLALQDGIANKFAKDNNWVIRRMDEYIRIPELRIGSSFDFKGTESDINMFLLEIKNVDGLVFKNDWIEDEEGNIEASPKIEIQIQHQMLVSGHDHGYIGACVGGNKGILLKRESNQSIQDAIILKATKFWYYIDNNIEPLPNFRKDAEFISKLYNLAEPGSIIDISGNEFLSMKLEEYKLLKAKIKSDSETCEAIKAELLTNIGTAEKVLFNGGSISTGLVGPVWIERHERKGHRMFRPYFKK